jgi:heme a synthase
MVTHDWRGHLPAERRRLLRLWFLSGAAITFLILVVGGATRLTESGLSIVRWRPIAGVIPPLGEAQWRDAFAQYQQFPEFQKLRHGSMTLAQFRVIFLWEYTHRLLARMIGLVFLIPAAVFAWRGYLSRPLALRVGLLFALGALQGFVGWFMVSSGLVDNPHVSHYRLALHLFMALTVMAVCLWCAHELSDARPGPGTGAMEVRLLGALLLLQILWGAFTAGLDAGLYFNTFPLMNGRLLPAAALTLRNALENPFTVQWVHRLLGTLLLGTALAVAARRRRDPASARPALRFAAAVSLQYALGIATLLYSVPVLLGVVHQAMAVLIFALWIGWLYRARRMDQWRVPEAARRRPMTPRRPWQLPSGGPSSR